MMGDSVFILSHVYGEDDNNSKIIGVFIDKETAISAVAKYANLPGFKEFPDGFEVSSYRLNQEYWVEGFVA